MLTDQLLLGSAFPSFPCRCSQPFTLRTSAPARLLPSRQESTSGFFSPYSQNFASANFGQKEVLWLLAQQQAQSCLGALDIILCVLSALSKALFVLKRDAFWFLILLSDALASSALIVTTLWTKVAPRTNFSFFFFFLTSLFHLLALDVPQSDPEGRFVMKS